MFQLERREQIMQRLVRDGRVDVAELAEAFDVTSETIRRDLTDLERERLVRRVHGGAIPWRGASLVPRLEIRESINVDEKRRIALAAAREVPESGSIIIDSGSTALQLADVLDRERELTVITNSIPIIRSLALTDRPEVVVLGGALERKTMAMVDETGVDMLRDISVDVLFVGCDGMSPGAGLHHPVPGRGRHQAGHDGLRPSRGDDVRPHQDRQRAALPFRRHRRGRHDRDRGRGR